MDETTEKRGVMSRNADNYGTLPKMQPGDNCRSYDETPSLSDHGVIVLHSDRPIICAIWLLSVFMSDEDDRVDVASLVQENICLQRKILVHYGSKLLIIMILDFLDFQMQSSKRIDDCIAYNILTRNVLTLSANSLPF